MAAVVVVGGWALRRARVRADGKSGRCGGVRACAESDELAVVLRWYHRSPTRLAADMTAAGAAAEEWSNPAPTQPTPSPQRLKEGPSSHTYPVPSVSKRASARLLRAPSHSNTQAERRRLSPLSLVGWTARSPATACPRVCVGAWGQGGPGQHTRIWSTHPLGPPRPPCLFDSGSACK